MSSFTIFRDDSSTVAIHDDRKKEPHSFSEPLQPTIAIVDKENVHPLTGEYSRTKPKTTSKKDKSNVLATKLHIPPVITKKGELKEDANKRKKLTPSAAATKSVNSRAIKASSESKPVKRFPKKVKELYKVEEEGEILSKLFNKEQANVNSRCYALTVNPLADVSTAYEPASVLDNELGANGNIDFGERKISSNSPEIRDYVPAPAIKKSSALASSEEDSKAPHIFSTPERKQIYAAFTFSSPLPATLHGRISYPSRTHPLTEVA